MTEGEQTLKNSMTTSLSGENDRMPLMSILSIVHMMIRAVASLNSKFK